MQVPPSSTTAEPSCSHEGGRANLHSAAAISVGQTAPGRLLGVKRSAQDGQPALWGAQKACSQQLLAARAAQKRQPGLPAGARPRLGQISWLRQLWTRLQWCALPCLSVCLPVPISLSVSDH